MITVPEACAFDPGSLQCNTDDATGCLTAAEVQAARNIYAGVIDSNGRQVMPGTGPGSELEWAGYASPAFRIGSNYFRHLVAEDPSWSVAEFDVDRDLALAEAFDDGAAKAMDPNLRAFVDRGGKLLIFSRYNRWPGSRTATR